MMEIEEVWGKDTKSCEGSSIVAVELVTLAQMIRLKLDNNKTIELTSCWRYRSEKSILIGALDIGFYLTLPDDEEELDQLMEEDSKRNYKKVKSLVGKKLLAVEFGEREVLFTFSGKRYIDWFCLSSDDLGFRTIETRDSMHNKLLKSDCGKLSPCLQKTQTSRQFTTTA